MRSVSFFLLVVALGAVLSAAPASAWPHVAVVGTETISVDPPRYRTTFDVYFAGYGPGYDWFTVSSMGVESDVAPPADSTHLFECGPPPGWTCVAYTNYSILEFSSEGSWTGRFSIISDREVPCVRFDFLSHLLVGSPGLNHGGENYRIEACLRADMPVPARPASWGTLKSRYR